MVRHKAGITSSRGPRRNHTHYSYLADGARLTDPTLSLGGLSELSLMSMHMRWARLGVEDCEARRVRNGDCVLVSRSMGN